MKSFLRLLNETTEIDRLPDDTLRRWAREGLTGHYSFSGVFDEFKNIDDAVEEMVRAFKRQIRTKYPAGLGSMPDPATIYRIVNAESADRINREYLGTSWFADPSILRDSERRHLFLQQLEHLRSGKKRFLITAKIPVSQIDVMNTLFLRDANDWENEIRLIEDPKIEDYKIEPLDH